jgi:hypothetical protein
MWSLQLMQLAVVVLSPAFFNIALYEANVHIVLRWRRCEDLSGFQRLAVYLNWRTSKPVSLSYIG